jgi:carboxyl-terminal processing protease
VAGYVTPSGRDIQGQGITPDRLLDQPEPLNPGGEGDRWLTDAERVLEAIIDRQTSEAPPTTDDLSDEEEMAATA